MEATQQTPRPSAKQISVGEVISETFSVYRDNLVALLGSALAIFVVIGLISGLLRSGGLILILLATIVQFIGYALYTGFVVELVRDVRDGQRDSTVGDLFEAATPFILPLILFGVLYGLGVGIGLFLLVIPGLILITFWSVGAPSIVIEDAGAIEAFGRSWKLVRGNAWTVFGVLLVALIIVLIAQFVLAAIATPIGDGAIWIASILSAALTAPVYAIVSAVLFFELSGNSGVAAAGGPATGTQQPSPATPPPPASQAPPPPPPPPPPAG